MSPCRSLLSTILLALLSTSVLRATIDPPVPAPCQRGDLYLQEDALSPVGGLPFQDVAPLGDASAEDSEVAEDFTTPPVDGSGPDPRGERWLVDAVRGSVLTPAGGLPAGIAVSIRLDDGAGHPGQAICTPGVLVPEALGPLEFGRQAVRLAFPASCALCAGNRYWVVLQAQDAGSEAADVSWGQRTTAAGEPAQWRRGGSSWGSAEAQGVGDGFSPDLALAIEGRRQPVAYVKGDLNRDLCPDLLFQHRSTGELKAWLMHGATRAGSEQSLDYGENGHFSVRVLDYIDDDVWLDLVVQEEGGPVLFVLGSDRGGPLPDFSTPPWPPPAGDDPHWVAVSGRFQGSPVTDLVCQGATPGSLEIWNGPVVSNDAKSKPGIPLPVAAGLLAMGAADFDGDGGTDFVFLDPVTGSISVVGLDSELAPVAAGTGLAAPDRPLDASFVLAGVADLGMGPDPVPGDAIVPICGTPDLLFQSVTNGKVVVWHLDFSRRRTAGAGVGPSTLDLPGAEWVLVAPR